MKTRHVLEGREGAPVVVLVHPLGATLDLWDAHAAALAPRYRVLRHDVRGHGGSEAPPGPYTIAEMAADLDALLAALGIGAAHVVGLSMGGLVAMAAALATPGRVSSLALCDTTACYGEALRPMWEDRIRVAETEGMTDALVEATMAIWFTPGFRASRPEVVNRIRASLRATDPRGYAAAIRAIGFVDIRPRRGAPRRPPLVGGGARAPGTPPAMAREIHERIPGSRLLVLPGAMHCAPVEAAGEFVPALLRFLETT